MAKSLSYRLGEIREKGVPYIIRAGNQLGEFSPEDIVDSFEDEELPEVVADVNCNFFRKGNQCEAIKVYAEKLAKLTDKKPEDFLCRAEHAYPSQDYPHLANVEIHLIYNPRTDLTHIFLLPSRVKAV